MMAQIDVMVSDSLPVLRFQSSHEASSVVQVVLSVGASLISPSLTFSKFRVNQTHGDWKKTRVMRKSAIRSQNEVRMSIW